MKRRGNRRYYQHHEVLMIRRIRGLLYDQGFTINGARHKLQEIAQHERELARTGETRLPDLDGLDSSAAASNAQDEGEVLEDESVSEQIRQVERELKEIRDLLSV